MRGGASFDATGTYRYHLWREWDEHGPTVTFVMLNPSTADEDRDDATIRRCVDFAQRWDYGRLEVVNLFAYRAASPRAAFAAADPEGPENAAWLRRAARSDFVVLGWGNEGARAPARVRAALAANNPWCLGLTTLSQPRHPLYVAANTAPAPFTAVAGP